MSVLSKIAFALAFSAVFATAALATYMRLIDAAYWNYDIDPMEDVPGASPNAFMVAPDGHAALELRPDATIVSPVFPVGPMELAGRLEDLILEESGAAELPSGDGRRAYVVRSRLMGFPDYVTFSAIAVAGGSALALHSRARFGSNDFKVNQRRVERWLEMLAQRMSPASHVVETLRAS